jgi:hypothetical protein
MSEGSERQSESERVYQWRFGIALDLGVPVILAERFADSPWADVHDLARLIKAGCTPITACRILI